MRSATLVFILVFLFSGCVKRGPAVYKPAPKGCRYTYRVKNRIYCVKKTARGYTEVGIASWYGPGFHGRRTASGEFYNMYDLTAAHKTLPLGTYVKVINLENGKSVIVRINDRGPFVPGRIIDLSYSAAKRLGMVKKGTAKVMIVAIGTKQPRKRGNFYVQIGTFKNKLNAYRFKHMVEKKYRVKATVVKLKGYYRVLAGPVSSYSKAKNYKKRLRKLGLATSFILRYH